MTINPDRKTAYRSCINHNKEWREAAQKYKGQAETFASQIRILGQGADKIPNINLAFKLIAEEAIYNNPTSAYRASIEIQKKVVDQILIPEFVQKAEPDVALHPALTNWLTSKINILDPLQSDKMNKFLKKMTDFFPWKSQEAYEKKKNDRAEKKAAEDLRIKREAEMRIRAEGDRQINNILDGETGILRGWNAHKLDPLLAQIRTMPLAKAEWQPIKDCLLGLLENISSQPVTMTFFNDLYQNDFISFLDSYPIPGDEKRPEFLNFCGRLEGLCNRFGRFGNLSEAEANKLKNLEIALNNAIHRPNIPLPAPAAALPPTPAAAPSAAMPDRGAAALNAVAPAPAPAPAAAQPVAPVAPAPAPAPAPAAAQPVAPVAPAPAPAPALVPAAVQPVAPAAAQAVAPAPAPAAAQPVAPAPVASPKAKPESPAQKKPAPENVVVAFFKSIYSWFASIFNAVKGWFKKA